MPSRSMLPWSRVNALRTAFLVCCRVASPVAHYGGLQLCLLPVVAIRSRHDGLSRDQSQWLASSNERRVCPFEYRESLLGQIRQLECLPIFPGALPFVRVGLLFSQAWQRRFRRIAFHACLGGPVKRLPMASAQAEGRRKQKGSSLSFQSEICEGRSINPREWSSSSQCLCSARPDWTRVKIRFSRRLRISPVRRTIGVST